MTPVSAATSSYKPSSLRRSPVTQAHAKPAVRPALLMRQALNQPESASPEGLLQLQRSAGNRAVQRLLDRPQVQTKLSVGPANDKYEQEADRVANTVMRLAAPPAMIQPSVQPGQPRDLQTKPIVGQISPRVQRAEEDEDEDEEIQTKRSGSEGGFEVGGETESQLHASRGGGRPLPTDTRSFMESRFGADFSSVRVHADGASSQLNRSMQAQAFTHGSDIYFANGKYNPGTGSGKQLLAHELTHVVQQGGAAQSPNVTQRKTEPGTIQRFALDQEPIPFDTATRISPSSSGALGVYFVEDGSDTPVVVKAVNDPVGLTNFANELHEKAGAGSAPDTRAAVGGERESFTTALEDDTKANMAAWQKLAANQKQEVSVEEMREYKIGVFKRQPTMYIMGKAHGTNMEDIAKGEDPQHYARFLLTDANYLQKLGVVTAIDLFLANEDRLLAGNLGNWMTDINRRIALIDNVDTLTKGYFAERGRHFDPNDPIRRLAPSKLQETALRCATSLFTALVNDAPGQGWEEWTDNEPRKRYTATMLHAGLIQGRKRLLHKLAPKGLRKRSRTLKAGVMQGGDNDPNSMWTYIKRRAKFLRKLR